MMKKLLLLTTSMILTAAVFAQQNFQLSKAKIEMVGTSTLHDWTAEVKTNTASATFTMANGKLTGLTALNLTMDANSIKSSKGSTMDKNMYKALKTSKFPNLTFKMTELVSLSPTATGYALKVRGKLTVAGKTQTVLLNANGKLNADGTLTFSGSHALKMTDYDVEPPEMFFGTLVTADDVTINFETTFASNGTAHQ